MWMVFAAGSAVFAGLTSILAKAGVRETDSHIATAVRTCVVAVFSWAMVLLTGAQEGVGRIAPATLGCLVLSGLATGASWICYYRALQLGEINKVVAIDKSSVILTILLAFFFLGETVTGVKALALLLIGLGTMLMLERKAGGGEEKRGWQVWAVFSAIFASLTSILGKVGIGGVDSNLGTAIRTMVVLVMAWGIVLAQGKAGEAKRIDARSRRYLLLSGIATGLSWLCYFRALQEGPASAVVPIDKLSVLVTSALAWICFGERLNRRRLAGLGCMTLGTIMMAL